jgi:hypothetical protein
MFRTRGTEVFLASGAVPIGCAETVLFAQLLNVGRQEVRRRRSRRGCCEAVISLKSTRATGWKAGENPSLVTNEALTQSWPAHAATRDVTVRLIRSEGYRELFNTRNHGIPSHNGGA